MAESSDAARKHSSGFAETVQQAWKQLASPKTDKRSSGSAQPIGRHEPRLFLSGQTTSEAPSTSFPRLADEHVEALFPIENVGQDGQRAVRAALHEMELNWATDAGDSLDGSKSDFNRGCLEIVRVLERIRVAQHPNLATAKGHPLVAAESSEGAGKDGADGSQLAAGGTVKPPPKAWETHDLLRAIDRQDTETILRIRNEAFDLLLDLGGAGGGTGTAGSRTAGGEAMSTPLGYTINLGASHEGIAIILVGALSKFVNTLPEEEESDLPDDEGLSGGAGRVRKAKARKARQELDPRTTMRLRKVRVSLKLAIDHSLAVDQTRLIASYIQVLLMAEGLAFIEDTVDSVSHALLPAQGALTQAPTQVATSQIERFVTDSLRSRSAKGGQARIAAVSDLLSNAAGDSILMALWDLVKLRRSEAAALAKRIEEDKDGSAALAALEVASLGLPLPSYFYARDERVTATFLERMEGLERALDLVGAVRTAEEAGLGHEAHPAHSKTRSPRALRLARKVRQALDGSVRRLGSKERLDLIRPIVDEA